MDLSEIRELWKHSINDRDASIAAWDAMAEQSRGLALPDWDTHPFLVQLAKEVPLTRDMTALDIGCGCGPHSISLAPRVGSVVGIDISPKMVECAAARADGCGVKNVSFVCGDFRETCIEGQFDLVIAHMTPAVADAATLERMLSLAKDYCYLVKPTRRDDPVLNALYEIAGLEPRFKDSEQGTLYAFTSLWQQGYLPSLSYRPEVWDMGWPLDQAKDWYLKRLVAYHPLDEEKTTRVMSYLESIAVNGRIEEVVHTTIATMSWRMSR